MSTKEVIWNATPGSGLDPTPVGDLEAWTRMRSNDPRVVAEFDRQLDDAFGPLVHAHLLDEAETSADCVFGCKIFRCSCGHAEIRHMASYGCPVGREERGAR